MAAGPELNPKVRFTREACLAAVPGIFAALHSLGINYSALVAAAGREKLPKGNSLACLG